jgi:cyclase
MLATRVIPCLDVLDGRVVKCVRFKNLRDAGDPVELAKLYNDQGADELTFLDIGASYQDREILIDVVERVSSEVFIPLTVGGGIRSVDDVRKILHAGADKVSVCTAAIRDPTLLSQAAEVFGSQCIVLSADLKRVDRGWHAYVNGGRDDTGLDGLKWIEKAVRLGAGEVLLNSIDMDGTKAGYDLELTRTVSESVAVPVIASGGAGTLQQVADAVLVGKADAVLLASLLHYGEYTIAEIKAYLREQGVDVR